MIQKIVSVSIVVLCFIVFACGTSGSSVGPPAGTQPRSVDGGLPALDPDAGATTEDGGVCVPSIFQGPVDLTHLPFGDSRIIRADQGAEAPTDAGYLWLCGVPSGGRGNGDASVWANADGTWDYTRKPRVDGQVSWTSQLSVVVDAGTRTITGNAVPSTPTGNFPIDASSVAYIYDKNPSHIDTHVVDISFPAVPTVNATDTCLTYGATGISLGGNAIYHGASTLANDAAAYEMLDSCGGQSDGTYTYHMHFLTDCELNSLDDCTPGHSALMGYIMDGFGIYGPRGEDGTILTSADLDECHGHTHPVMWDGQMVNIYHYHWTYDFPYNVGCFKGTPQTPWN